MVSKYFKKLGLLSMSMYMLISGGIATSQVLYNNGATIYAETGVVVFVDGTVLNDDGEIEVVETGGLIAEMIVQQDFINNAIAGGNGYYRVLGNWENNNTFNAGSGSVFLEGNNQLLTGSESTYFFNLILDGIGIKTQTIDQYVLGTLNLNHLELATETHSMFVENTDLNAILRTDGFVSSLDEGFLSRNTNISDAYLFPVGSSVGENRYRPVEISPNDATNNTFTVRMANVDATTEGFDRDLIDDDICETNPLFYHRINRTNGSASIDLSIFFDEAADGNWDGIANWTVAPNQWEIVEGSSSTTSAPLSYAYVNTWNAFNQTPYILYNINPEPEITPEGPFCENDSPIDLSANIPGGTWSGSGIIDATDGTFDPETAGAGNHIITYEVNVGGCIGTDMITIEVIETPDATITDPGDFCDTDDPVNLVAATAGGIWSGEGITDANVGTFDPAVAGEGNHEITYTITENGCSDSDQTTIGVFGTPDASITHPGTFCSNDDAVNLNSATAGGTWSGNGITDANAGTFDPAVAGAGDHIITYNVGIGDCSDTDNITITVNQTPDATITDLGDFCDTDDPVNLVAATAGGIWSGEGITDAIVGTFDPAVAGEGNHEITYTITENGCSDSDQITIGVFGTPDASITHPGIFCSNDDAVNLNSATAGGTWSGNGITDANAGTFDPAVAGEGDHIITYNVGIGDCSDTDNITITVNQTPNVTCPDDFVITEDDVINLTGASPDGGIYSGTSVSAGQFDPSSLANGDYTITYTYTDDDTGCSNTCTFIITVDIPEPIVMDCPEDITNVCETDDPFVLQGATPLGGEYSGIGVIDGSFYPSEADYGQNLITYTYSGETCTYNIFVTEDALGTINPVGPFCLTDSPVDLSTTTGVTDVVWSGDGITDPSSGTFSPSNAGIGVHEITVCFEVFIPEYACPTCTSISITVLDSPDATINPVDQLCTNDPEITLSAATPGGIWSGTGITDANAGTFNPQIAGEGTHTVTYSISIGDCNDSNSINIIVNQTPEVSITHPGSFCDTDAPVSLIGTPAGGTWTGTGITDENNGIFDPIAAGDGNHTITYQFTTNGCTGSDQIIIEVFGTPDATINDPGSFCDVDAVVTLTAATSGGTWSGNGITDSNAGTFDPSVAGIGNHVITYNVGVGNCSDTDNITISVFETPQVNITNPGDFCDSDDAVNLEAVPTGGTWSGDGIVNQDSGLFDPAVASAGTHIITYELTQNGCTGTDQISINVLETPDATITPAGPFCSDDNEITLTAVTPGGTWAGPGITNASAGTFDPSVAGVGNHTITYTVGFGACADSDQITIIVYDIPTITIQPQEPLCSNESAVTLSAEPEGGIWSGNGIIDENNGIFDPSAANIGNNTITYQYGEGNCIGSEQITIIVLESVDATIEPTGPFCFKDTVINLNAATDGGIWSGNGVTANGVFNITQAGVGNHLITYVISGECGDSATINIEIFPSDIQAEYVIENPLCMGGDDGFIEFAVTGGTPPYTFEWDEGGYSETNYISGITEGEYTITIIDNNGCFIEVDGIIITDGSDDCIFIPNAFTPNGDGINDEWIIDNIEQFPDHQIQVFNRWGQEVYFARHGEAPWDGTLNNKPLPTGNYIYVVQLSQTSKDFVGIVTLIR